MRGKRGKLVFILVVLATLSATTGRARTSAAMEPARGAPEPMLTQQATSVAMVEPIADGTKNPALIPEAVALRVLFLTPANSSTAGLSDAARLRAKLGRMQLDASDMAVVTQALGQLQPQATQQLARIADLREEGRRLGTPVSFAALAALDGQLDQTVTDTYRQLLLALSPAGAAKLRDHVAYIKTKIKIIPPPNMTTPHH